MTTTTKKYKIRRKPQTPEGLIVKAFQEHGMTKDLSVVAVRLAAADAIQLLVKAGFMLPNMCGTVAGARRHDKRGEHRCEDCRIAWNDYNTKNRAEGRWK